mmetsp:Transcript_41985/g.98402  ORF Transcript_41985/g.98402 Transcript_41985/m.98402 type:complete len:234 (-) Transcript_41985:106-807(-)
MRLRHSDCNESHCSEAADCKDGRRQLRREGEHQRLHRLRRRKGEHPIEHDGQAHALRAQLVRKQLRRHGPHEASPRSRPAEEEAHLRDADQIGYVGRVCEGHEQVRTRHSESAEQKERLAAKFVDKRHAKAHAEEPRDAGVDGVEEGRRHSRLHEDVRRKALQRLRHGEVVAHRQAEHDPQRPPRLRIEKGREDRGRSPPAKPACASRCVGVRVEVVEELRGHRRQREQRRHG